MVMKLKLESDKPGLWLCELKQNLKHFKLDTFLPFCLSDFSVFSIHQSSNFIYRIYIIVSSRRIISRLSEIKQKNKTKQNKKKQESTFIILGRNNLCGCWLLIMKS